MRIGKETYIDLSTTVWTPHRIMVGDYSHINRECFLDGRAGITIGSRVSISHRVSIITGSHDVNSKSFKGVFKPIVIEDYVWIGIGATILQGVKVGQGAVIAAGSVVTKDVEPYSIIGGIPARVISTRNPDLDYKCLGIGLFS